MKRNKCFSKKKINTFSGFNLPDAPAVVVSKNNGTKFSFLKPSVECKCSLEQQN